MTSPQGYAAGIGGLAAYIGKSPKATRALLARVKLPAIRLPGTIRETVLFKLSDVDEALARYRVYTPVRADIDIDRLVDEVLGAKAATR